MAMRPGASSISPLSSTRGAVSRSSRTCSLGATATTGNSSRSRGREGGTDYLVNVSRFETDGFRGQSQAEIRQANIVVRNQLSPATEIRGVFNFYDSPFAGSPSFLNEEDARNNPRMGRDRAIAQNWHEATTQGQGGVTIEHQFSGGPILRATGWGVGRDLRGPRCRSNHRPGFERAEASARKR